MEKNELDDEKRELLHLEIESKTMQIIGLVISNLMVEIENFTVMITKDEFSELEGLLERLTHRNDTHIETFNNVLQIGLFLPFDESFLYSLGRSLTALIDSIEAFGHRLDLHQLPQKVRSHLIEMLNFLDGLLSEVFTWIEERKKPDLKKVQDYENSADICHRNFMKDLYSSDLDFHEFILAKDLNSLLEHSIDLAERMAENVDLLLKVTQISEKDPPTYLS